MIFMIKVTSARYLIEIKLFQGAVGLELWSMSNDIYFDNFIITDDRDVADKWASDTWELKREQELLSSPSGVNFIAPKF